MCRAGDWKTAVAEHKSSPAQDIANESGRKVQATGAWLNPESKTKWPTDTCPNTTWYEFSPNAAEPKRIEDPTGFRKGGLSNGGSLGDSESKRETRPTYDAYGSTTTAAAAWEASWEYGGWLTADRNLGR